MSHSVSKRILLALAATFVGAGSASAWGPQGHEVVCRIAVQLLKPQEQQEVDRLVKLYKTPAGDHYTAFPQGCTFADRARSSARAEKPGWTYFSRFNSWHFLNVPRDTRKVKDSYCGDNCVLTAVDYHAGRLANHHLEDWKRAEALLFLGHWVGDAHQPLHVSYEDDLGGNDIKPILGDYYDDSADLHAVWDSGIIGMSMGGGGWSAYADHLKDGITPALRDQWRVAKPLEWAQESYAITTTKDVQYCDWTTGPDGDLCSPEGASRDLTKDYQDEFQTVVETRLQQAGVRLAERIHKSLGL